MRRAGGPVDKAARARRRAGGALAVGRPSATREVLEIERAYVERRAGGFCELCAIVHRRRRGTDFAHVLARSQGGEDTRFNALWACNLCNLAMQGPYKSGRPLVTPVYTNLKGQVVRGFFVEWVRAAGKFAYRLGAYEILGAGFIRAEVES